MAEDDKNFSLQIPLANFRAVGPNTIGVYMPCAKRSKWLANISKSI